MRMIGGALVLLGLALAGLQESCAVYWAYHSVLPSREREKAAPQPSFPTTPSYFPDNDFSYPSYSSATPSVTRSSSATATLTRSYYFGGEYIPPESPPEGELPFGISASTLPWNQVGFEDYKDSPEVPRDASHFAPRKYSLKATPLPLRLPAEREEAARLIARLPEHALFWVEGKQTRLTGQTRYFESPPLRAGEKYSYTVRVAWIEDGRWVSQTEKIPVRAGLVQAIYLQPR
jgi:uncharacterized protein (TIGR03000 family)